MGITFTPITWAQQDQPGNFGRAVRWDEEIMSAIGERWSAK
jgi:hypothetical protein